MAQQSVESTLTEYLSRFAEVSFSWRQCNCVHFAGGWVGVVEGWDPLGQLQFAMPRSQLPATRLALRNGGLPVLVSRYTGRPMVLASLARVGDLVFFDAGVSGGAGTIAICNGRSAACLGSVPGGVVYLPMDKARCAWHIQPKTV